MAQHDEDPWQSRISPLTRPEVHSSIPEHVIAKLDQQEQYLLKTISQLSTEKEWLITALLRQNQELINAELRLQRVEAWKSVVAGKWGVAGWVATVIVAAAIKALAEKLTK